jgi:hypothetical protein
MAAPASDLARAINQGVKALLALVVCGLLLYFVLFRDSSEASRQSAAVPATVPSRAAVAPVAQDFRFNIKAKYKSHRSDVMQAVELARQQRHCLEVLEGSYDADPTADGLERTPYYVTCRVDNPTFPANPYANYFYTTQQIADNSSQPSRIIGASE